MYKWLKEYDLKHYRNIALPRIDGYANHVAVQVLTNSLENRIKDATVVLEITSKLHHIMSILKSSATMETLHGITYDSDMQKEASHKILSNYDDIAEVAFILPNG